MAAARKQCQRRSAGQLGREMIFCGVTGIAWELGTGTGSSRPVRGYKMRGTDGLCT